jgi:hypothetical protein
VGEASASEGGQSASVGEASASEGGQSAWLGEASASEAGQSLGWETHRQAKPVNRLG